MCFTVTIRTNEFALKNNNKYSPEQEKIFKKIKSLHQSALGYRKIAHKLNAKILELIEAMSGGVIMFVQFSKDIKKEKIG